MLEKAVEKLNIVLRDLNVNSEFADDIMEALFLIQTYIDTKEIIYFVMEHYTTEQIIKRCERSVVEAFAKDYREFITRKKAGND